MAYPVHKHAQLELLDSGNMLPREMRNQIHESKSNTVHISIHSVPPPFLQGGGLKNFQCWQKWGGLPLFEFFGAGGVSKKGEWIFSRGPEDFLKVIFNC